MRKILLIEDNLNIRENTAEILELASYTVITAENGKIGVEKAIAENPDLIICDIMMPVLDGYGVLYLLHKNPSLQHIPFIFLTAKSERSDIRKGMDQGADDYLIKPFGGTELLTAVESRFKKADLVKQEIATGLQGLQELLQVNQGENTMEWLTTNRDVTIYKKKQTIYLEGSRPLKLYYVQSGKVKTYKTNEDGKELILGLYKEGDFLGHVALLEGTNYKESAAAIEDAELVIVPRHEFDRLIDSNREVARKFIGLLAKNVTDMEDQLLKIAYNSLRKKVADTLVMLHKKYRSDINISRENLATVAGTATESLIRTLSDFKSEHLIDIKDGSIVILNERKLETLIS